MNNRKTTRGRRVQTIMVGPTRLLKEKYLSHKGMILFRDAKTKADKQAIWDKYGKNRYTVNPNSVPARNDIGRVRRISCINRILYK